MTLTFTLVIGALLCVTVALANECFVLAPNRIRLDSNETLTVFVEGEAQNVVVTMTDYSPEKKELFAWTGNVTTGRPQVIDFLVKEEYFPDLEQSSQSPPEILIKAHCGTLPTIEARVMVTPESGNNIFIQTDKPIYRPGETVSVFIISLDGRLRPLNKPFLLELRNPHGHTVEETDHRNLGRAQNILLPQTGILGTWSVVVRNRRQSPVLATKSFKVDKYILPLFTVKIEGECSFILDNSATLHYTVSAKYADGGHVNGSLSFRLGTKGYGDETLWSTSASNATALINGSSEITITREELQSNRTADEWQALFMGRKKLVFEATVTDAATGVKGKHTQDACVFTRSPFVISFEKSVRTYKPGVKFYVLVEVSYPDGKPARKIGLHATVKNAVIYGNNTVDTDEGGQAIFALHSGARSTIIVTVTTAAEQFSKEQQAKESADIKPYIATSAGSLAIERHDPRNTSKVDDSYKAVLSLQPTTWNSSIYYLVIAKGRVINAGRLTNTSSAIEPSFDFKIEEEMTPSFRVMVFSKLADGTMATDSIYVRAESSCSSKNWVTRKRDIPSPGSAPDITIRGPKGSVVKLIGVDNRLLSHDNHLMTKETLSAALDSKDLGCGAGGGIDADEDFVNSGVFLLSQSSRVTHELRCQHRQRRKRDATTNHDFDDDITSAQVRRDMRDMWIFDSITIQEQGQEDSEAEHKYTASLPDTITTWTVGALRVSPEGGVCVAEPLQVEVSRKDILLDVRVPYFVKKNEHIQVPVTVYNKGSGEYAKVSVFLHKTPGICIRTSGGSYGDKITLIVPRGKSITTFFPVAATETGHTTLHAMATGEQGGDSVVVPLRVEDPGLPQTNSTSVVLDPTNRRRRKHMVNTTDFYTDALFPNKTQHVEIRAPVQDLAMPGTQKSVISVIGVKQVRHLKAAVEFPTYLLSQPAGDAARIMTRLASTIYAYGYREASGTLTGDFSRKAHRFITRGLLLVKQFRKPNGAFSFDRLGPSSVWATSFILRSLCEANRMTKVEDVILKTGLSYLVSSQMRNGGFQDVSGVDRQGSIVGGVTGPIELSAYTILAIAECTNAGVQVHVPKTFWPRSSAYLERHLPSSSHYTLAIGAYALSVSNSSSKARLLGRLKNVVNNSPAESIRYIPGATNGLINEATAYAMLAFINEGEDPSYVSGFTRRLNKHLRPAIAFGKTQETVVGMQALARYAAYTKWSKINLMIDVSLRDKSDFKETILVQQETSHILKKLEINDPGSGVHLKIRGVGIAVANITFTFNKDDDKVCQVQINTSIREEKRSEILKKAKDSRASKYKPYMMEVCLRALGNREIEKAAVDIGILTGFEPDFDYLKEAKENEAFEAFERTPRSVRFTLPSIPHTEDVCLNLLVRDVMRAGNVQASYVHVFSEKNREIDCTKFYNKENTPPLVKLHCDEHRVCKCMEGGCPSRNPFIRFLNLSAEARNGALEEFTCEKVDFAWYGTILKNWTSDGFIYAQFYVNQTIKKGLEDTDRKERNIRLLERCSDTKTSVNNEYIFMGKDSEFKEDNKYVYALDSTSMWISVSDAREKRAEKRLLGWLTGTFAKAEEKCRS